MTRLRTCGPKKGKRYYVISTTGGLIRPASGSGSGCRHNTSYSILDSFWGHREVATFYAGARDGISHAERARRAAAECARLNADEAAWEREVLAS